MKGLYFLFATIFLIYSHLLFGQCPPPGFPQPGNNCPTAPILCENLDGYCATINNNNAVQTFPGCPGWQLNNDEWFAFYAGTTSITIQVTPSNCSPGNQQGLQGGIYAGCGPPWTAMDLQCACTENPFILSASNFVIGQIYYFVLDGCAGNVCDYSIDVLDGSTVGAPPANPGAISGPTMACQGSSSSFTIPPVLGATIYTWSITPAGMGTVTGSGPNIGVNWNANASGTATLCLNVANACYPNPTPSCYTIDIIPKPTAMITGSGVLCAGASGSVPLTVNFTGQAPWQFVYTINGAPQPAIQTSNNPYTLMATQPGTYAIQSVSSVNGGCVGTVSGNAVVTQTTVTANAQVTNAQCGQSNGAINLSVGGGTAPYTFLWSGGQVTEDLSNIPPGGYTVTVTDANGCTKVLNVAVNDNVVNINVTGVVAANTTCNGGNGSIDVSVNPAGTYTYNWSNNEMTQDISNLPPGSYTVTVTAGPTCSSTATFNVPDNPNTPNIASTVVQSTCDLSNGSINLNVTGGVAPYTFMWDNGASTSSLTNIPAGSYAVTVTGANGCSSTANINVGNNNPPINITSTIVANTTCNGGNGSITLNIAPAGMYTITWSGGETTQNLTNLPPGTYDVTVSGGGSCTQTASFTVPNNPNTPNISASPTASTCDLSNGAISVNVTGGVAPYTYMWLGGQSTPNLGNIPAGTYDLTVTGANGCSTTASITVGNNNPPITITPTVIANTTCNGGNGSISLTVTPPGSYTFIWAGGQTTSNIGNLPPGTYDVTVNGGGSCTQTASITVPDNPNNPVINPFPIPSTCDLSNGSVNVSVSGGVAPFTYLWSTGAVTPGISGIPAGGVSLTVTGANGCSSTANINIPNINPPINISGNAIANTSCNNNGTGSISINVAPPGAYTFTWSNNATTQNITGLQPGTYTVTVSGGGSCTQIASFTVPDNPNTPQLSFSVTAASCGLNNGSINLTVIGGVAPYLYQWGSGQVVQDLNNIPAGDYTVTVTGANGCVAVGNAFVPDNAIPISLNGNVTPQTSCVTNNGSIVLMLSPNNLTVNWSNGSNSTTLNNIPPGTYDVTVSAGGTCTETASFTVDDASEVPFLDVFITPATCGFNNGSVDLEVFSGQPPFTYKWSNNQMSQDIANLPAGNYAVTVTSAVGCTSVIFAAVPSETIAIDIIGVVSDNYSCGTPNGYIDIDISPPGNYMYNWSNGKKTQDIENLTPGNYTVTVSIGVNCSAVASFDVLDATVPPNLSVVGIPATCGLSNGGADATVSGGAPPYTYHWSNNATTQDLSNIPPGTYSVTVSGFFGCSATATVTVANNNIALNISGTPAGNNSCIAANGAVNISVAPAGAYTYLWSNAAATQNISGIAAGTYTVTVTAGANCSSTATFTVADNTTNPDITPVVTADICSQAIGAIDLTVSGAPTPYTYSWSNMAVSEDLNSLNSGNYSVTVTAGNGCTADTTLNVPNNSSTFSLSGTATPLTSCISDNGAINLTVTPAGPYTYLWSNAAVTEDLSNLAPGTYTVSVTETGNCTATASFTVNDATTFPSAAQSVTPEICGLSNGGVDLTVSGGATPYTFMWTGGAVTEDLNGISTGSYTVTVTGANGCSVTTTANVPENSISFSIAGTPAPNTSCVVNNGSIDVTITPSTPGPGASYTFSWSNNTSNEDLNGVPAGNYTVTVSAGGTCTNTATYVVGATALPPSVSDNITPASCGQSNGDINLSVSGGQSPYTFIWSNSALTEDINTLPAGTYTVTVTGANSCTFVKTYTVPDDVILPNISGIPTANTSCTSSNGGINVSVTPALNYTFLWSNSQTTQNLANVPAGMYSVTVNGGGNCINVASFTVDNNTPAPVMSAGILSAFCSQSSGGVDQTVVSGTPPITYAWSNNSSFEDLTGVPPGNYTVTVSSGNGCTSVVSYVVPDSTMTPVISGSTLPNTLCVGSDGSVTINVTPALPYTYKWSNNQTTQNIQNLTAGVYTVTVSAGGACTSTASFTVGAGSDVVAVSGSATNILCFGANDGAIALSVSGGVQPYQYNWAPGIPGNPPSPGSLPPGAYAVTVTDAAGCSGVASFTITQPSSGLQLTCKQSSNVSLPGASDGAGTVNISGGVGPYTIVWSPGSSQSNVSPGNFVISNLSEGNYAVSVTDANGCVTLCGFAIALINCETAVGTMSGNALSYCGDGCLTAVYNATGQFLDPNDAFQFVLHEGNSNQIVNEIARNSQPVFCFDPATMVYNKTYYISAVAGDNDGTNNVLLSDFCTAVAAGTPIIFREKPIAAAAQPEPINCVVPQVSLSGSSSVAGSAFAWSTFNGTIIGNANQPVVTAGKAGNYTLIVSSFGCTDTTAVQVADISNNPMATILANPDDVLDCTISEIILSGQVEGTAAANVIWISNGVIYPGNTVLPIDQPGVYEFVILDTLTFCSDTASIVIDEDLDYPPLFLNPPGLLTCINTSVTLSGGSPLPGIQFSWATVNGTDTTIIGNGTSTGISAPGNYYLIGIDPLNQCSNILGTSVLADITPPVADAGAPFSIACYGETASLDGSASSGTPGLTFLWSSTDGSLVTGIFTPAPVINEPGTYTLLVTNPGNGCTDTDNVVIVPDEPVPTVVVKQPRCYGDKGSILITDVQGAKPPIRYSIDGGQQFTAQNLFTGLTPGDYTILIIDAYGCSTSADAQVEEGDIIEVVLEPQAVIKLGESYQIDAQVNLPLDQIGSIEWTPSTWLSCDTCLNPLATPPNSYQYKIKVSTLSGCEDTAPFLLVVDRQIDVYVPNIFSPDNNGNNDLFTIYADPRGVTNIKSFQIFSRWGEMVYEHYNFQPNSPTIGWDGKHRGQELNPGVFVWHAVLEFIDGTEALYKGDVTVKR